MQDKEICIKCKAECCKRYFVSVLPFEAKKIAKHLNKSLKSFIKADCIFHLRIVNAGLTKIKLPTIALKKPMAKCIFLSKNFECKIYAARPVVCKMFPFLSIEKNAVLKKLYPFCLLLNFKYKKKTFDESYYNKVKKYFSLIERKGWQKVWPAIPDKGILIENGKEKMISRKKFLEILNS